MSNEHNLIAAICSHSYEDSYGSQLRKLNEQDEAKKKEKTRLTEEVGESAADRIRAARIRLNALVESSRRVLGRNMLRELSQICDMLEV